MCCSPALVGPSWPDLAQIAATIYMAQPLAEQAKDAVLQGGKSKGTALVFMANIGDDCNQQACIA